MIWLQQLAQDAGFALRVLRRMPAFTATIILTLALGIGMTSAVFSVFNAVLLRPLSYLDPERLVSLSMSEVDSPFPMEVVGAHDFLDWKEQSASFEHIVAYDLSDDPVIADGQATQERIAMVSDGFWELTGVRPAQGRVPASGEQDTVLVSYAFFEARLGGDAGQETIRARSAQAQPGRPAAGRYCTSSPWQRSLPASRALHCACCSRRSSSCCSSRARMLPACCSGAHRRGKGRSQSGRQSGPAGLVC